MAVAPVVRQPWPGGALPQTDGQAYAAEMALLDRARDPSLPVADRKQAADDLAQAMKTLSFQLSEPGAS
jgi:hypothetical protein